MVDGPDESGRADGALADAPIGRWVKIVHARLEPEISGWLAAVGLEEGETIVVLRRAALGGPLHVRTSSGGEFAVARDIAARLDIRASAPVGTPVQAPTADR